MVWQAAERLRIMCMITYCVALFLVVATPQSGRLVGVIWGSFPVLVCAHCVFRMLQWAPRHRNEEGVRGRSRIGVEFI